MDAAYCDGSAECKADLHVHGCYVDTGNCDEPDEYHVPYAHEPVGTVQLTPEGGTERV